MSTLPFFFQTPEFINRNPDQRVLHFRVDDCSIYFSQLDRELISLYKSPFGSFVIQSEDGNQEKLKSLIAKVVDHANKNRIESIEIKCYPQVYSVEKSAVIEETLTNNGFRLKYKDITQILFCDGKLDLDLSRKRRVDQCAEAGFVFEKMNASYLPPAYDLFLQSREMKGYPVTMQLTDFISEFDRFPDRFSLYGVKDKDKLVAASVVIEVNADILYYFFAGDDLTYRKLSPSTYLIYNLFEEATRHKYKMIDLGLSTDKGILNKGLYDFKKSFGAVDSLKLTFEKSL